MIRSTIYILIVIAAAALLSATLLFPVFRIYGNGMTPTLAEGEVVIALKTQRVQCEDIVGVYFGSKPVIRRCIAVGGQCVDISQDGVITVDGKMLDEPYLSEKFKGDISIDLPFVVPNETIFVLCDNRGNPADSRSVQVGCITQEDIIGRVLFRLWPFGKIGIVK